MKILFLSSEAWDANGGIAKFNRDLLRAFEHWEHPPQITKLTMAEGKFVFVWKLWQIMRQNSFDRVICGHLHLSPAIKYFCKNIPQKSLILHGIEAWRRSRHFTVNRSIAQFTQIIAVSELTQKRFLKWAPLQLAEMSILPNCVNLQVFEPGSLSTSLVAQYGLKDKKVLLTLGRLERPKGIDEVLEIIPTLIKKVPQLRYLIAGTGSDQLRLEQKCQTLGIRHLVEFTGFIAESQKVELYRLADVFVMPGYGEGFGIVYLEAVACGIPAIGSKLDGSVEALRKGKLGLLVNPHHPHELLKAIHKALTFHRGLRPLGLEYFSFENFVTRTQEIFRNP